MKTGLVTEYELLWVVDGLGNPRTSHIAECLPIKKKSVYVRMRSLNYKGYIEYTDVDHEIGYRWSLNERGEAALETADLPPFEETDLEEYFAGRSAEMHPDLVLATIARAEDEWVTTSYLFEHIDFAKTTIRYRLYDLDDAGHVDKDNSQNTNRWRVTDAGYKRLADSDETIDSDDTYIWREDVETNV